MDRKTKILFRADGNQKIGLGHVYRCLAIAEYLEDDFDVEFIASKDCSNIKKIIPWDFDLRILLEFDSIEDEAKYLARQYARQKVIFVVDGYQFTTEYLKIIKDHGIPLVYIDDKHEIKIHADMIINHAAGFSREDFDTDLMTNICIGPEFAILRRPFLESERKQEFKYEALICFGGADPDNHTMRVLRDLPKQMKVAVLVGRAYQYVNELKAEILGMESASFFCGLASKELAELMEKSERAIMSASSVAYEYSTASSGQLYIIQTADNQKYLFKYLTETGAARAYQGVFEPDYISRKINDGKSPERILRAFKSLEMESEAEVRNVGSEDVMTIYQWVNDRDVRSQSYNQDLINLDDHKVWFEKKLIDTSCFMYMILHGEENVGQIRFDVKNGEALISFLTSPEHRGIGWGRVILKKGIRQLIKDCPEFRLARGYVKESNLPSQRSFIKCNFIERSTSDYPDSLVYTLAL